MFRLDLLENAFIVYYETPPKPYHDLIISSSPYLEQPPHNFSDPQKFLSPPEKLCFGKMLVLVILQFQHSFTFFFFELRLHIIPRVIRIIFK